jgi:hypothetical protein
MFLDETFEDVVLFDIPTHTAQLYALLRKDRLAWMHVRDEKTLVAVALRPNVEDLGVLLRSVESWMADERIVQLRFEIDGRSYALLELSNFLSSTP